MMLKRADAHLAVRGMGFRGRCLLRMWLFRVLVAAVAAATSMALAPIAHADPVEFDDGVLAYTITSESTVNVTGCLSDACPPSVTIPVSVHHAGGEYTVMQIGDHAFYEQAALTSVEFANGSKVQIIGASAFANTSLSSIVIPASVYGINTRAFAENPQLEGVEFEINSILNYISVEAFFETGITNFVVPEIVGSVGCGAFANTRALEFIVLAGSFVLEDCGSFPLVDNSSVKTIHHRASFTGYGSPAWQVFDGQDGRPALKNDLVRITLDLNGHGPSVPPSVVYRVGTDRVIGSWPDDPMDPDYLFFGWSPWRDSSSPGDLDDGALGDDVTLYAQWVSRTRPDDPPAPPPADDSHGGSGHDPAPTTGSRPITATASGIAGSLFGSSHPVSVPLSRHEPVTVQFAGLVPSTRYLLMAHSTPRVLADFDSDDDGSAEVMFTVPADLAAGGHTLTLSQVMASRPFVVPTDAATESDLDSESAAPPGLASGDGSAGIESALAVTGSSVLDRVGLGMVLIMLGGLLVVRLRRNPRVAR